MLNVALRDVAAEVGDAVVVMADLCLDEFTDHGHCGVLDADGRVDNDATLARYAEMAVVQADAGAHMVGPSGMMDGQVGAVRAALDDAGHLDVGILAYAAKYASAFYGPFREAVESSLDGRPARPTSRTRRTPRGAARGRPGRRRGRRHRHGQARDVLPRRAAPQSPTPSTSRSPPTRCRGSTR